MLPPRKFTLLDGLILIAATAPGILSLRAIRPEVGFWPRHWTTPETVQLVVALVALVLPCVLTWTLALPVLRLYRPHPPARRLSRQPGMVASAAVALALALTALAIGAGILLKIAQADPISWPKGERDWLAMAVEVLAVFSPLVALAVAGAWASLVLGGRWRAERDWIDRAGRTLGVVWMLAGFALSVYGISQFLL